MCLLLIDRFWQLKLSKEASPGSQVIAVNALSRRQRDIIALTARAFQATKIVNASAILEQIVANTHNRNTEFGDISGERTNLDFYLIFDQLNRHLNEAIQVSDQACCERQKAVSERNALEQDLEATITMYQKMLEVGGGEVASSAASPPHLLLSQKATLVADLENQIKLAQDQARRVRTSSRRSRFSRRINKN